MRFSALFLLSFVAGCAYDENIPEKDLRGKVILPAAAATQEVLRADGTVETVEDMRLIGPVYLGAFAGIDTASFPYPHPAMGPVITSDYPGNTFPYGGTTVGRLEYGCYEAVACRVTTGRFGGYADVLDYFANFLADPVVDANGQTVESPSTMQQACFDYHKATSDAEIAFIDNGDLSRLNFQKDDETGDYVAEFTMPHTVYVEGMQVWGWMDAPRITRASGDKDGQFSSCDSSVGRQVTEYDQDYFQGRTHYNLLNFPSLYIYEGDWVSGGTSVESVDGELVVNLDIPVTESE